MSNRSRQCGRHTFETQENRQRFGVNVSHPSILSDHPTTSLLPISTQDNSVVNRWGGEIRRNKFTVDMLSRRGQDRGIVLRYGKNITGISENIDDSQAYQAVLPSYLDASDQPVVMPLMKSPYFDTMPNPRTVTIHFGDIRLSEELTQAQAEQEVQNRILNGWANGVDLPQASCEISFVELRNTLEYKDLAELETILLGDTIRAVWSGHIDVKQRVIAYEWDALRDRYISIHLGSPRRNVASLRGQINAQIQDAIGKTLPSAITGAIDAAMHLDDVYVNAMGYYPRSSRIGDQPDRRTCTMRQP